MTRQYDYIHMLERNISPILRGSQRHQTGEIIAAPLLDGDIYHREGEVYLRGYPLLLNVAWIAYVILFPLIVVVASVGLVVWEWRRLPYPPLNRGFDTLIALTLVIVLLLYRVQPYVAEKLKERREKKVQLTKEPPPQPDFGKT